MTFFNIFGFRVSATLRVQYGIHDMKLIKMTLDKTVCIMDYPLDCAVSICRSLSQ